MPSLFGRRKTPKAGKDAAATPAPGGISSNFKNGSLSPASVFNKAGLGSSTSLNRSTGPSSPASPGIQRALSDASLSDEPEGPLELKYGYLTAPLHHLEVAVVEEVVRLAGEQIKRRGLELPLILSTKALDISKEGTCALINTHLQDRGAWRDMLAFANCHDLGGQVKYALGRIVNPQGKHGILGYDIYERWRMAEKQHNYPPQFIKTHLLSHLPSAVANLLYSLFDLLSATAAYAGVNGSTPKKLSAIFSAYIFGMPCDEPFERSYAAFTRYTNATAHLLGAFIRCNTDQLGSVPPKLQIYIKDYPNDLASSPTSAIRPDVQLRDVKRVSRLTRFYHPDLIQSAPHWEVPRSKAWNALYPWKQTEGSPADPVFSSGYKHLLNIAGDESESDEHQRFKTTTEKDWFSFASAGFQAAPKDKLRFDLNESARQRHRGPQRGTRDWTDFSQAGFLGQDVLDRDLSFDTTLSDSVSHLADEKTRWDKLMRKAEKGLPEFPYDTTPHEGRSILCDEYFFEAWADVLVSSGWLRDEIKDSNWVLIQFRSRPVTGMMTSSPDDPDGRIEDVWFLIEESVPEDYRMDVAAGKTKKSKRLSFLKPMRKKPVRSTGLASMNHLPPALPQAPLDDSVFSPGTGGTTRYLALDRPPSESMDRPMTLNLNQSFKLPPGKEPVSPISAGHGALPGTMTSQPSPKPQSDFPRSSTTEDRPDKSASNGLKRRSSSFEHIHARGVNLLGRMRTRRQRNQSISSMSDAGIEHRSGSPSITEFGASSGNGSWVNLMRRGTQNSRGSMDSNRVHMQQQQAQTFNSPAKGSAPAVHVRTPTVERDLPAVPIGSSAPSFVASSNEAVEELGGHPTSSRASMEEGELWRGSRYDTTSPDQIMEAPDEAEEEDFYRPERPRAPSPSSVNEQPLNTEDVPTIHSTDVTADHTTHVPPAPVQTPTKAPPVPEKTATSSPSTSGPHSERVAKLVAMYSNRDGKRGSAVQKKPVPALPVE